MVSDFIVHLLRSWVNSITFLKSSKRFNKIYKIQQQQSCYFENFAGISPVRKREKSKFLFTESLGDFSHQESHSKVSNLTITELYYSFFYMKRGSLLTRSFRRIDFSVISYWWTKNGSTGLKKFPGLWRSGPLIVIPPNSNTFSDQRRKCHVWSIKSH